MKNNKVKMYLTIVMYVVMLVCVIMLGRDLYTLNDIKSKIETGIEFEALVNSRYTELLSKVKDENDQPVDFKDISSIVSAVRNAVEAETTSEAIAETELGEGYVFERSEAGYIMPHKTDRKMGELNEYGIPYIVNTSSFGMMYYQEFGPNKGEWLTPDGQFVWTYDCWNPEIQDFEPGSV